MSVSKLKGVTPPVGAITTPTPTPLVAKAGVEYTEAEAPSTTTTLPPVFERSFKSTRAAYNGLFRRSTPDLELRNPARGLGPDLTRRLLVQFVRDAGLDMPREMHESRAGFAQRQAIGARSVPEKIAWLTLAFDGYLSAARFDAPTSIGRSQRDAGSIAEILSSIVPTEGQRQFWLGARDLLRGHLPEARQALDNASQLDMRSDLAATVTELLAHVDAIEVSAALQDTVTRINAPSAMRADFEAALQSVADLTATAPHRALRFAVVGLEARRRLAALDGKTVSAADANKTIDVAFKTMADALEARNQLGQLESLPHERALLVARNHIIANDFPAAESELAEVIKSGTPDQVRQAAAMRFEVALKSAPGSSQSERLSELETHLPLTEARVLLAGAAASTLEVEEQALSLLDRAITALSGRGSAADYNRSGHSVVTARITTSGDKSLELPGLTLTADEGFVLGDAKATRALIHLRRGDLEEASKSFKSAGSGEHSPRLRLARTLASLASGDVGAAQKDIAWLQSFGGGSQQVKDVLSDPFIAEFTKTGVLPTDAGARASQLAQQILVGTTDAYLTASSAFPLASVSDIPVSALFGRNIGDRDTWGAATLGTFDAHIVLSEGTSRALARGTEAPASAALRGVNPKHDPEMAAMVNSLISRKTMERPAHEFLLHTLSREALQGATENFEVDTPTDELAGFVAEQFALQDHTHALTLGCSDKGLIKQTEDLLSRHASLGRHDAPRATSVDQVLGHLNAVASLGMVAKSKKRMKAKDKDGGLRVAWREISDAVKTGDLESLKSVGEARTAIQRLGFKPVQGRPDLYDRHGVWVRLAEQNIGEAGGYDLQVGKLTKGGAFQTRHRMVSVDGLTFEGKHWRYFEKGYVRTTERYANAMRRMAGRETEWRSDMKGVRALIGLGRSFGLPREQVDGKLASKKFEMGMQLHNLGREVSKALAKLQAEGRAPKGVMIMVDGIDAASKTSNGERLMEVFKKAGYDDEWKSFKAPTAAERKQHWLARYDKHRPQEGQVFMCDRSPLGDYAYNKSLSSEKLAEMAEDFRNWQEDMESEGILVLNFLFYPGVHEGKSKRKQKEPDGDIPDLWRPMFTFGKREGRALAAREMLVRAKAAGAPQDVLDGLEEAAKLHPGLNDLKSFHDGVLVHTRFRAFADAIETEHRWEIIPTERRHKGRKRVLRFAAKRLKSL